MKRSLMICLLSLLASSVSASVVKVSTSGTVNPLDLRIDDSVEFCCSDELRNFSWSFESTFDLDDYYTPSWASGDPSFINIAHESSTFVDGVKAPTFFNKADSTSAFRHGLQTYDGSLVGSPTITSVFSFSMGNSFDEDSRFMVTESLYVRNMSIDGFYSNLYDNLDDALSPDRFFDALLNDLISARTTFSFVLGDATNPEDNSLLTGGALTSIFDFNISLLEDPATSDVSAPNTIPLVISSIFVCMLFRTKSSK
ncbi:hypothetical protein PN836_006805 [Ningiella sp. W23]|uniref:hypothetical protein n=1 Tax=Ningiella sp. W23 TaxID=3023715 RepID=UPI00375725DA